jgi:hypothetical protein
MNLRARMVVVVLVGATGAILWSRRSAEAPAFPSASGGPGAPGSVAGDPSRAGSGASPVEAPADPTLAPEGTAAGPRSPQPAAPELALEPVSPLLELALVQASSAQDASEEPVKSGIDGLLEGRHGTKTRVQLELSLRSIRHVLDLQATPDLLPKGQILDAPSIQALEIEAGWLKERIYR